MVIMMFINNVESRVKKLVTESIDGELVLFNAEENQSIMLNRSASIIWEYISGAEASGKSVSTDDIVSMLCSLYSIPSDQRQRLYNDVIQVINGFYDSGLLIRI